MLYEIKINDRIKNKILGGKQVFSSREIKKLDLPVGELVKLVNKDFVAFASINPLNSIRYARILHVGKNFDIHDILYSKIKKAYKIRKKYGYKESFRLIYSESDYISGLIIDKFNDIFVIQNSNPYLEKNIDILREVLIEIFGSSITIINKSIGKSREFERLPPRIEVLYGDKTIAEIEENNKKFIFDILEGQKTGWFLDQKENRHDVSTIAYGDILDVFSYVGGFGIQIKNYESITFVEKSKVAVNYLRKNAKINNLDNYEILKGNAFEILKDLYKKKKKYDTIILDPPDLLQDSKKKGWKSLLLINSIAIDLIKDGGIFVTFSCSENVREDKFYRALISIFRRKGYIPTLIKKYKQSKDHHIIYSHKELEYLKGFAFILERSK